MAFRLVMTTADGSERSFPICKDRTLIGRADRCDVRIPIPSVEPKHCEITCCGDKLRLIDLGSAQGTLHNGSPVHETDLAHHDRVTIGPVTLEVRATDETPVTERPDPPSISTEVKPQRSAAPREGERVPQPPPLLP